MNFRRILLDPQGGPEGGTPPSVPDPAEGFKRLLEKHQGDGVRLAETLHGENYKLRERLRKAEDRVPGDNDVVLKGDDAKRWAQFTALGDPGDLKKALKAAQDDAAEVGRFRRAEAYARAAEVAKFHPRAFARLAEQDGLEIELITGKDEKVVAHVKAVDEAGKPAPIPIEQYAEAHWPEFLGALREGQTPAEPERKRGTPPPRQPTTPRPPNGDPEQDLQVAIRRAGLASF